MSKRFDIVVKAKLNKKKQAEREAKDGKRPKLPWKKSRDGVATNLGAVTEMSFKEYLKEARYHNSKDIECRECGHSFVFNDALRAVRSRVKKWKHENLAPCPRCGKLNPRQH